MTFTTKDKTVVPNKKRLYAQVSTSNLPSDDIFFQNFIDHKFTHAIFFANENHVLEFNIILKKTFKNNAYKLIKSDIILQDIDDETNRQKLFQMFHEGKTNHRGILETESRFKRTNYWPT